MYKIGDTVMVVEKILKEDKLGIILKRDDTANRYIVLVGDTKMELCDTLGQFYPIGTKSDTDDIQINRMCLNLQIQHKRNRRKSCQI